MVTIISDIFINIFQTEHGSSVKFPLNVQDYFLRFEHKSVWCLGESQNAQRWTDFYIFFSFLIGGLQHPKLPPRHATVMTMGLML